MSLLAILQSFLLIAGALMFCIGSLGLIRFPDTYTRIHALTKADNLGLGLIVLALILNVESVALALKLLLIWGLVMIASALSGHLVAWEADEQCIPLCQPGETERHLESEDE
ncbi:cation:proton antiporter [Nitrincola alkalisediminis]|uniref:cation:proton antiporter n=1 Tax=Nitrincola alkalisediminis TaxID=1366656 RepID=UPI001874A0D4|nr:monovalent cation/H(+) antiporter subunit G [Nitrincola alkalisediminis]